jgi:hypothetical protein
MEEKKQNEINLLDLMQMFFRGLGKFGLMLLNLLGNTLRLLYRNKVLTCIVLVLCIVFGFYLGRPSNRVYRAEAMAILNGSLAQTVKDASRRLENTSQLSDFTTLSAKLNLPDSIAHNIVGISSYYVIDFLNDSTPDMVDFKNKHSWTDTLNVRMPNRLYFRILTRDVSQIPVFEQAFLNYFNTDTRILSEFNVKKNSMKREIDLLDTEINRLDSMADIAYFRGFTDQQIDLRWNTLLVGEQRKQLIYKDFLYLQNLKTKREIEFANFTAPVVMPTGFIVKPRPETGRMKYMAICGIVGVFIAIGLSLFVENRKCIFNYLSKK